jgi:hypothetical protein
MSGGAGGIALARIVEASPALEDFRFSSSRGERDGGIALAAALGHCPNLRRLDLSDGTLAIETAEALNEHLFLRADRRPSRLEEADFSDIFLEQEGFEALVPGLLRARALQVRVSVSRRPSSLSFCLFLSRALP